MALAIDITRTRPTAVGFTTKALEQVRSMRAAPPPFLLFIGRIEHTQHGELE